MRAARNTLLFVCLVSYTTFRSRSCNRSSISKPISFPMPQSYRVIVTLSTTSAGTMTSVRRRVSRAAKVVLLALLLQLVPQLVGATTAVRRQVTYDQFHLTAWGSAHVVMNANHLVVDRCGPGVGAPCWNVINTYLPFFCQLWRVDPGNAAGTPMNIYVAPINGSGLGCYPNGQSWYYGFHTGTGWAEGQNLYDPNLAPQATYYFWPRNPGAHDAYGFTWQVQ